MEKQEAPEQSNSICSANVDNMSIFKEVTIDEVMELAQNLPDKSCPLVVIPIWLFKKCLPELILYVIHYIVNESLNTGVFPSLFKTAVVRPGLKKPNLDSDVLNNSRRATT